jgi:hypothetical protein
LIHAEHFDLHDHRDDILDAATVCRVYDTQVDGHREWWLARLCETAGLVDTVIQRPPVGDHRDLDQRCALLKEFVINGHAAALPALYAMCCRDHSTNNVRACEELIEADGEKGLLHAARILGQTLVDDPAFWINGYELDCFDDLHQPGSMRAILIESAVHVPVIAHLLKAMNAREEEDRMRSPSAGYVPEPVETIQASIAASTKRQPHLIRWGKLTSLENRRLIARMLYTQLPPRALENALRCLWRTGLPDFDPTLLELVNHPDAEVARLASQVFSNHSEPEVRQAGLAALAQQRLDLGITLLRLSARGEDEAAILSAIMADNSDDPHNALHSLVNLITEHPSLRAPWLALHAYEHSHCMHCRCSAFKTLVKWQACPEWVRHEAASDADPEIRKQAQSGE